MKLLSYIVSFYFLALMLMPCCSMDDCRTEQASTSQTVPHDTKQGCGTCSPFACAGCSIVSMKPDLMSFPIPIADDGTMETGFIDQLLPTVHFDFWHPPRVV